MKNKLIFAFLMSIMPVILWAQNLPGGIWTSPQSTATEGRYRSNADDFIRPDTHSGVRFNKWFGMTAFTYDESFAPLATMGFATKINALYISAFYSGNLWTGLNSNDYTEELLSIPPAGGMPGNYNVYNNISVVSNAVNNVALLFGYADMGLRITFRTNHQSFSESDIVTGNQYYENYHAEYGYLIPQIAWAFSKDLISGKGIRPYAALDLEFNRDYQKTKMAGADEYDNTGEFIGRSINYFSPVLSAGLGGFHFYNQNGFRVTADFDFSITAFFYDNEYNYVEDGVYRIGRFNGTNSGTGDVPLEQCSFSSFSATPSLAGSWSNDRLALRFKFNLVMTYSLREATSLITEGSELLYNGNCDITSSFSIRPDLRLAMQFKIVPDRLNLNAGARIQASAITLETIDHDYYYYDSRVASMSKTIHRKSFGSSFVSRFHIGPVFYFTDNLWIETNTGVSNAYGDNAIEIFAAGGLFSFGSILACLKF